jgi:hypothetical protein
MLQKEPSVNELYEGGSLPLGYRYIREKKTALEARSIQLAGMASHDDATFPV